MKGKRYLLLAAVIILLITTIVTTQFRTYAQTSSWTPTPVADDPLVRMPGTQPTSLSYPGQCGCHQTNDNQVSIVHDWQGSMMGQASRDFLFWATMTVAAQDAIWAIGNPNATDICERCHFPFGWINGRSDPTNASAMESNDYDGVQCAICHYMFDPFFEDTAAGTREGDDWVDYWDESDLVADPLSAPAVGDTLDADRILASPIEMFNGEYFFDIGHTPPVTYTENGSGQFFLDTQDRRRASFADAEPSHGKLYSRYHKSKYYCSTCHDISNPVLANLNDNPLDPLTTETEPAYAYYHVERTFSEFMLSDYGLQGGAAGIGFFDPDGANGYEPFETSQPGNLIASCQDCHMRDETREAVNQGMTRPTDSDEHPNSGQPAHDLTGGNVWVPTILASIDNRGPNHDGTNEGLLDGHVSTLTLDFGEGDYFDADAIFNGATRSQQSLETAAVITDVRYSPISGNLSFMVQNQTGHKLISGFPEGRRLFVNIKYYDVSGTVLREVNPYDTVAGTLQGLVYTYTADLVAPAPLTVDEIYVDELVYEMHGSSSLTDESESFHFVLSDGRYKDNRIPPKGFRIAEAAARKSEPVWHGASAPDYFTPEEYAGGYDLVSIPGDFGISVTDAVSVVVTLNYQTTSREYIEFLRNEINDTGELTLSGNGVSGDPPYLIQTDPFFDRLRGWGDTIWALWTHNMTAPGAAPIVITSGQWDSSSPTAVELGDFAAVPESPSLWLLLMIAVMISGLMIIILARKRSRAQLH